MFKRSLLALISLCLLLGIGGVGLAQDDKPTVAILRFGPMLNFSLLQESLLLNLRVAGLVSEAEAEAGLDVGQDLDAEQIRFIVGDANLSFASVNLIVDQALDAGADVLITFSTPVTQAAINATQDMEDPPAVLFGSVYNPYEAGIAQASCLKPAHVTGVEAVTRYEEIVPLLLLQNPEIRTFGTVYSSTEASGRLGAEAIVAIAEALGLRVEQAAVTSLSDLAPAAEGLIAKGIEAFLIPSDLLTVAGLPTLTQVGIENRIPVFHSTGNTSLEGATVGAGVLEILAQGSLLGALLGGHLSGEIDISRAGIASVSEVTVGVSLDSAALQGVEITEALLERADVVVKDGLPSDTRTVAMLEGLGLGPEQIDMVIAVLADAFSGRSESALELPPEVTAIVAQAMAAQATEDDIAGALADLHCTDEMITQQQAELDAAEG